MNDCDGGVLEIIFKRNEKEIKEIVYFIFVFMNS